MLPYLPEPLPRLVFFGGKGGVGKTTMAAATAIWLAKHMPTLRVTVASSDPAHSLGDVLGLALGGAPTAVPGAPHLTALHIDAAARWKAFVARHRDGVSQLLADGLELSAREIERALGFSIPGLDEIVALLEVERMARSGEADLLIVDTAPTGHTVRLLELPDTLPSWLGALDSTRDKQRYIASRFGGSAESEADRFVRGLLGDLKSIRSLLRDRARCRFVPVMVPEPVVMEETRRLIEVLKRLRIPLTHVIVNRDRGEEMAGGFPSLELVRYPLAAHEIVGPESLAAFVEGAIALPHAAAAWRPSKSLGSWARTIDASTQILLVAGMGGVGKSTIAGALGLEMRRRGKTLLYSTDPAHSLADVLEAPVGHAAVEVAGLWAQQIDPFRSLEEYKKIPRDEVEELFDSLAEEEHADLPFERKTLSAIMDLVPPGLDEAIAMAHVSEYLAHGAYRYYVLDTAPTGHLLRLLETPDLARQWLGFAMDLLVNRGLSSRMPRTAALVARLIAGLERLGGALRSERCRAVVVTTCESVVLAETERLVASLREMGVHLGAVVVNMAPSAEAASAVERRVRRLGGTEVVVVPRLLEGPRGADQLTALTRSR